MPSPRFATGTVAIALVIVVVVLWVAPSQTDFAPSNRHWNGLSTVVREFGLVPLTSLDDLPTAASRTALVVIPSVRPSGAQLAVLRGYVEGGGLLVILHDSGFGDDILAGLGIPARFGNARLVDPLFSHRSRRLPRIVGLAGGPLAEGVGVLVLNHAAVIHETTGLRVIARSSLASFLDANGNGSRDPDEPQGPFPVAAHARVGAGRVVMIGDASLATNGMLGLGDNRRFMANVLGLVGDRGEAFLDLSLLPRAPVDVAKLALGRTKRLLAFPVAAFAIIAAGVGIPLMLWLRPPGGGG